MQCVDQQQQLIFNFLLHLTNSSNRLFCRFFCSLRGGRRPCESQCNIVVEGSGSMSDSHWRSSISPSINSPLIHRRLDFGALSVYWLLLLLYWQQILCLCAVWTSLKKVCLALNELTVNNRLMMSNESYLLWVKLPEGRRVVVCRWRLFVWSEAFFDESPFGEPRHSFRKHMEHM